MVAILLKLQCVKPYSFLEQGVDEAMLSTLCAEHITILQFRDT